MTDFQSLRGKHEALFEVFEQSCRDHGFADEWAAYRSHDGLCGEPKTPWPDALLNAHTDYINALHDFYLFRDGPLGFLGGREAKAPSTPVRGEG